VILIRVNIQQTISLFLRVESQRNQPAPLAVFCEKISTHTPYEHQKGKATIRMV